MPREGIFTEVLEGGEVKVSDSIIIEEVSVHLTAETQRHREFTEVRSQKSKVKLFVTLQPSENFLTLREHKDYAETKL